MSQRCPPPEDGGGGGAWNSNMRLPVAFPQSITVDELKNPINLGNVKSSIGWIGVEAGKNPMSFGRF